jgi:antitoxin PrlF
MGKILHAQSTLTDRYQTTIPEPVREILHLSKRDKIDYLIEDNGKIIITRAEEEDPVIKDFLLFLTNDMKKHPKHIKPISATLYHRANSLVSNIDIDLDAPLSEKDE